MSTTPLKVPVTGSLPPCVPCATQGCKAPSGLSGCVSTCPCHTPAGQLRSALSIPILIELIPGSRGQEVVPPAPQRPAPQSRVTEGKKYSHFLLFINPFPHRIRASASPTPVLVAERCANPYFSCCVDLAPLFPTSTYGVMFCGVVVFAILRRVDSPSLTFTILFP